MSEYAYAQTGGTFGYLLCCDCGEILCKDYRSRHASMKSPNFCPNCGERIGKRRKLRDGELTALMKMQVERFNARAERLRGEGGTMTDSKTAIERTHTWSYLCDTCRLSGFDMGIFGPPGTEWECWASWEDGEKPFMKVAINGEQDPMEVCPNYKRKEAD